MSEAAHTDASFGARRSLSKVRTEIEKGKPPYQAILDGRTSKTRPVCMAVFTTVLGMIPLLTDAFFGAWQSALCLG